MDIIDWDRVNTDEINELMEYLHAQECKRKDRKKKKRRKKDEIAALRKELNEIKDQYAELKRENFILQNKVYRLEHEEKMNQPRRKHHPGFYGAPFYCWGTDAWR